MQKIIFSVIILLFITSKSNSFTPQNSFPTKEIQLFNAPVFILALSPDKKKLAVGSKNGEIKVIDIETKRAELIGKHEGEVNDINWTSDSRFIISGSSDSTVKKWDIKDKSVQIMREHEGAVYCIAIDPKNKWIASGGSDKKVILWHPKTNEIKVMNNHTKAVWAVAFNSTGKLLASGGGDGDNRVLLWKYRTNQIMQMKEHERGIHTVQFYSKSRFIMSGSADGNIKVWNLKKRSVKTISLKKPVWQISSANDKLFFCSGDNYIYSVNTKTDTSSIIYTHNSSILTMSVSSDLKYIFLGDEKGRVTFLYTRAFIR